MDAFEQIISAEFLQDVEPQDEDETVYGLRVLYFNAADVEKRITVLIPWLSYDLERAERMRHIVSRNPAMIDMALSRSRSPENADINWIPIGVRVVTLAEVPF